jgi:hypothetical protein
MKSGHYVALLGAALLLFFLSGCAGFGSGPSPSSNAVFVSTNSNSYRLSDTIRITVRNDDTNALRTLLYQSGCSANAISFESYNNGRWAPANVVECPHCMGPVRLEELAKGAPLNLTFKLSDCNAPYLSGKYRVVFTYTVREVACEVCSASTENVTKAYSSDFTIEGQRECSSDSECAPAQCCHSVSCTTRKNSPNCSGIFCTAVCIGPMDCGAGRCACLGGKCSIAPNVD